MSPSNDQALAGTLFDETAMLTFRDLSRICAVDERHLVELVEEGVLSVVVIEASGASTARRCAARAWPCGWNGIWN